MSYVVLARRYRPQIFADLVGQEHVTKTLSNAVLQKRTAHAYLFTGPRGVGKTSAARILAKALRCLDLLPTGDPCNKCEACVAVNAGSSMDVVEIDAASNTGVDNIRDLRENVEYMASVGKYRVYIIDEVHMLSTAAFNALLKTLEEPPPHVVFIFATTELHKVLPTIQSRCQRFDFKKILPDVMTAKLREICVLEKIQIDDASIKTLVVESEGCMRDSESLLDQAIALCGNNITIDKLESALGLLDRASFFELVHCVGDHDPGRALKLSGQMMSKGIDPKVLLNRLVDFFCDLHYRAFTGEMRLPDDELDGHFARLIQNLAKDEIVRAMDLGLRTQATLYQNVSTAMTVESFVVKLCLQRPALPSASQMATPQNSTSGRSAGASDRPAGSAPGVVNTPRPVRQSAPTSSGGATAGASAGGSVGGSADSRTNTPPVQAPRAAPSFEEAIAAARENSTRDAGSGSRDANSGAAGASSASGGTASSSPAPTAAATDAPADLRPLEQYIRSQKPAWTPVLQSVSAIQINDGVLRVRVRADFAGKRLASPDGIEVLKAAYQVAHAIVVPDSPAPSNNAPTVNPRERLQQKQTMAKEHDAVKAAIKIFDATITETKILDDGKGANP